jgi:flavin reductase (DIM6/NTAB) family NADH-FMN oxidoreductase RutF
VKQRLQGLLIMPIDPESFKAAMRHLAGHVCIITTVAQDGSRSGLTATAVCSVSADPPTLLCCINRQSASHAVIVASGIFAVNVLAHDDRHLADRFAGNLRGEARFGEGLWYPLQTGAPVLESALASFDCRLAQGIEVATHGILFGTITEAHTRKTDAKPLLYAHGNYGGFTSFGGGGGGDMLWIPNW